MEAITDPGLLLKITPPRLRKTLLVWDGLRRSIGFAGSHFGPVQQQDGPVRDALVRCV